MRLIFLLLAVPLLSAQTFQLGGAADPCTASIAWSPPAVRYAMSFTCSFQATRGASPYYTVTLGFSEPTYTVAGKRLFDVSVNGYPALTAFDPVAAGASSTVPALMPIPAVSTDGMIQVQLNSRMSGHNAILSSVAITPASTAPQITRSQCQGSTPATPTVKGYNCPGIELYTMGTRSMIAVEASAQMLALPACPASSACWQVVSMDAPTVAGANTLPIGPQKLVLQVGTFGYIDVLTPVDSFAAQPVGFSLSIGAPITDASVWSSSTTPAVPWNNDQPATLGMTFRSDMDGMITGIRFYKGTGNNGIHVGLLYSSTGALLGQARFSVETASGWQQVSFPTAVPITANTAYVAAFFSTSGYPFDASYFASTGVDNPPLHALESGGVYMYGASPQFPASGGGTNYWVDPIFSTSGLPPPAIQVLAAAGPQVLVPNVTGLTNTVAKAAIAAAGLVLGAVTTMPSNTVPPGSVISQSPTAGSMVNAGAGSLPRVHVYNANLRLSGIDNSQGFPDLGPWFKVGQDAVGNPCPDNLPVCNSCCALIVGGQPASWDGMPTYRIIDGHAILQ
jgi:hypothetical protein